MKKVLACIGKGAVIVLFIFLMLFMLSYCVNAEVEGPVIHKRPNVLLDLNLNIDLEQYKPPVNKKQFYEQQMEMRDKTRGNGVTITRGR